MKYYILLMLVFVQCLLQADDKINKVKTLQTYGLDLVEGEYKVASDVFASDENKLIWIEAENSYLLSFYTNGDFVDLDTASEKRAIFDVMSASYLIHLPEEKKIYDIWVRVYLSNEGSASIESFLDGDVSSAKNSSIIATKDNLKKWAWIKINSVKKLSDYQKLTLSSKGNSLYIDKILLAESNKISVQKISEIFTTGKEKKISATKGTWLSEVFRPAGVRKWKQAKLATRNEDSRLFKIFWKTRTRDWTLLNRSRTLDLDADYKNGDFIQFKIDFYKEGDQSTSFAGLEVEYETNPFVLKEAQSKSGKVSVSFINGKIYELLNKTTGKNYLPVDQGIMPFLIYIKDANGENIPIDENDFYPLKPELKVAKNGEQIFRIPYKGEKSNIRVDLQMTLNPNSDVIDSSIEIKHKSDFVISAIEYPRLSDVVMSDSWEDDKLVYPLLGGLKISAPAAGAYLNNSYPDELSMRWVSIYGKNGSLMLANNNQESFNFKVWHNISMNGINLSVYRAVGEKDKLSFSSRIVIHDGDWQASAEIYGASASKNKDALSENFNAYVFDLHSQVGFDNRNAIKAYHEYLNASYIESFEDGSKVLSFNNQNYPVHKAHILTENMPDKKSVLEVDAFGDNPEVFNYTFPQVPVIKSYDQTSNYESMLKYYQEQWVYNRILPISGELGRCFLQARNRVGAFIQNDKHVIFNDALDVEEYQNNRVLLKRYDYVRDDVKLITLLYKTDGKPKKLKLNIKDIGRISAVFHNDLKLGMSSLAFQYVGNEVHLEIPASSYDVGSITLLHGNQSKSPVKSFSEYDISGVEPVIKLTNINFSSGMSRIKINAISSGLELEGDTQFELKAGSVETVVFKIKNHSSLSSKISHVFEIENQSQGSKSNTTTSVYPYVLNFDFSESENNKPKLWTSSSDYDSYIGNNKKGSFKFHTPISSLTAPIFLVGGKKYTCEYFYNISNDFRGLNFEIIFSVGGKGEKNMSTIKFKSPETKDLDFWSSATFDFETPANLQNAWIKISSTSSKGVVWLDDIKIKSKSK